MILQEIDPVQNTKVNMPIFRICCSHAILNSQRSDEAHVTTKARHKPTPASGTMPQYT